MGRAENGPSRKKMTKTENVILKPVPELTEVDSSDRLQEFYRKLGWDEQQVLKPTLVKMHDADLNKIISGELAHAREIFADVSDLDIALGVSFLWLNKGPSAGGNVSGYVELHPGWVQE